MLKNKCLPIIFAWFVQDACALEKFILNGTSSNTFNDESLIECVVNLTQITIILARTILILENRTDDNDDIFFNNMIKTFANNDVAIVIQDTENTVVDQTHEVYDGNVIIIVHFETCDSLLNFNIHNVDKEVKHLIIISNYTNESYTVLQKFGRKYIDRDVTFIIRDLTGENHSIEAFLTVLDEKTCKLEDELKSKQINICSNGSLKTNIVFPDESRVNFKNCPFIVGMSTLFPFSTIPNKDKLKNYELIDEIEGSDVEIMKIFAGYFNASPEWRYINREEQNPFINQEYVEFIKNGSYDACAGGLYNIYGDLVSYSGIYTRQAITLIFAVNRPSRSWLNLVFKIQGICLFLIFYISYSILSYLFRKYDCERSHMKDIIFYSWGALISTSSLPEPKSLKHKILDIFYLVSSIYLSAYMNIQLFGFLTIDRPPVIYKTNDEIIASGRVLYLNPINKQFTQEEKYLAFANTSADCGDFYDCGYKTLAFNGITVILDEHFYTIQAATAVNDEAKILRPTQNIVTIYQEILIKKDSILVVGIQKVLNRLFEAGICKHLFTEAIGISVVAKAEIANKNAVSNSYSCRSGCAITLSQLAGIFYVWVTGCFLSVCVLLLETMWQRSVYSERI